MPGVDVIMCYRTEVCVGGSLVETGAGFLPADPVIKLAHLMLDFSIRDHGSPNDRFSDHVFKSLVIGCNTLFAEQARERPGFQILPDVQQVPGEGMWIFKEEAIGVIPGLRHFPLRGAILAWVCQDFG